MNVLRDRIARRAAAIVDSGREPDIRRAVRLAAESLGFREGAPLPGDGEVRRHLRGMALERLGDAGYRESVDETLAFAAEAMDALERAFGARTLLAGRAARSQFDGGAVLHIRLYARASPQDIATVLVDLGMDEPSFGTAETVHGRASMVRSAIDGVDVNVLSCLPEWWDRRDLDLVTGRPTAVRTLESLRADLCGG